MLLLVDIVGADVEDDVADEVAEDVADEVAEEAIFSIFVGEFQIGRASCRERVYCVV